MEEKWGFRVWNTFQIVDAIASLKTMHRLHVGANNDRPEMQRSIQHKMSIDCFVIDSIVLVIWNLDSRPRQWIAVLILNLFYTQTRAFDSEYLKRRKENEIAKNDARICMHIAVDSV